MEATTQAIYPPDMPEGEGICEPQSGLPGKRLKNSGCCIDVPTAHTFACLSVVSSPASKRAIENRSLTHCWAAVA